MEGDKTITWIGISNVGEDVNSKMDEKLQIQQPLYIT
jgi:hypothetical protein